MWPVSYTQFKALTVPMVGLNGVLKNKVNFGAEGRRTVNKGTTPGAIKISNSKSEAIGKMGLIKLAGGSGYLEISSVGRRTLCEYGQQWSSRKLLV